MGGISFPFFLLFLIASSGNANPVCDFTVGGDPKWVSAAMILADTILDHYIPVVGPWAEAFIDIMDVIQTEDYSVDLTACVETLIQQRLEDDVKKSTGMVKKTDPRLRDTASWLRGEFRQPRAHLCAITVQTPSSSTGTPPSPCGTFPSSRPTRPTQRPRWRIRSGPRPLEGRWTSCPTLRGRSRRVFNSPISDLNLCFCHFNLPIEMQIGALMRRTDIPHLRPILNTLKLQT